jgi:Ca-activated chloride channel family protein
LWAQRRIGQIIEEIDQSGGGSPNQELVDELVALSKEFGVITPYTSFLALEEEPLTETAAQRARASRNLSQLESLSGADANWQRETKIDLMQADQPVNAAPMAPNMKVAELQKMSRLDGGLDQNKLTPPSVLNGQAFFRKDGSLLQSDMTDEDLKGLKTVKRFSPEYFELARKLNPGQMAFLTQADPLAFKLGSQSYLIED